MHVSKRILNDCHLRENRRRKNNSSHYTFDEILARRTKQKQEKKRRRKNTLDDLSSLMSEKPPRPTEKLPTHDLHRLTVATHVQGMKLDASNDTAEEGRVERVKIFSLFFVPNTCDKTKPVLHHRRLRWHDPACLWRRSLTFSYPFVKTLLSRASTTPSSKADISTT